MEASQILLYPLMGEKATILRERENKLTFIVHQKATKKNIQRAVGELYNVKVLQVNTMLTPEGEKKAIIKLPEEVSAEEIASKFGVL